MFCDKSDVDEFTSLTDDGTDKVSRGEIKDFFYFYGQKKNRSKAVENLCIGKEIRKSVYDYENKLNVFSTLSPINDLIESISVVNALCSVSKAFKSLSNNFSLLFIFNVFAL